MVTSRIEIESWHTQKFTSLLLSRLWYWVLLHLIQQIDSCFKSKSTGILYLHAKQYSSRRHATGMQRNHGGELSVSSELSVFLIYRSADTKGRGRGAGRSGSLIRSLSHERRLLSLSLFEAAVRLSHGCIGKTHDPGLPRRAVYYSSLPKHDSEGGWAQPSRSLRPGSVESRLVLSNLSSGYI